MPHGATKEDMMDAEREREIRDDQTIVVLRALRAVLERKTDRRMIEVIIEDVQEELSGGERYA